MRAVRLLGALALAACTPVAHAAGNVVVPGPFVEEIIVSGLDTPNSMAFLPDGRLLFTEQRTGRVRMVVAGHVAVTDPALTVDSVTVDGFERGLQGIAVDPGWPSRPYIYVCFTRAGQREWIVRYTGSGDLADPTGENLVFDQPLVLIDAVRDAFENHNGGTLRFGLDGRLYASLGDDSDPCSAAELDSLRGKLLRLDVSRLPAGSGGPVPRALLIPPDNPFAAADSNAALVYAYGVRNPWRFHIDPATGTVYLGDVGDFSYEEIDEVHPGDHLGWPWREGPLVRERPACPEPGGTGASTFVDPIIAMDRATGFSAILTACVYRPVPGASDNWPSEYHGNLFFGDHYQSYLRRMTLEEGVWVPVPTAGQPDSVNWSKGMHWVVDFLVGPDGSLWWLKQWDDSYHPSSGMVRRIRYVPPVSAPVQEIALTLGAAPNPFVDRVTVSFASTSGGPADLGVYDLAGRRVRLLHRGDLPEGTHAFAWDGRDDRGQPAPPGIYLARVRCGDARRTIRMLRVR